MISTTSAIAPESGNPSFAFALVNYKSPEITPIALQLIQKFAEENKAPIWVVDNDSRDESTSYLRSLPWVHLIERTPVPGEAGFMAHALGLDAVLERLDTDFLFVLHTDTFVHNTRILQQMLDIMKHGNKVAVVGCMEQVFRGALRSGWRYSARYVKHHYRKMLLGMGLTTRPPRRYFETYLKSFCALWDVRIMKQHQLSFAMAGKIPGYHAQDELVRLGYSLAKIRPAIMFRSLDHMEAGTVAAIGGYGAGHRRTKLYRDLLAKLQKKA